MKKPQAGANRLSSGRPLLATGLVVVDILLGAAVLNVLRQAFLRREAAPSLRPASLWSTLALSALTFAIMLGVQIAGILIANNKILKIRPTPLVGGRRPRVPSA